MSNYENTMLLSADSTPLSQNEIISISLKKCVGVDNDGKFIFVCKNEDGTEMETTCHEKLVILTSDHLADLISRMIKIKEKKSSVSADHNFYIYQHNQSWVVKMSKESSEPLAELFSESELLNYLNILFGPYFIGEKSDESVEKETSESINEESTLAIPDEMTPNTEETFTAIDLADIERAIASTQEKDPFPNKEVLTVFRKEYPIFAEKMMKLYKKNDRSETDIEEFSALLLSVCRDLTSKVADQHLFEMIVSYEIEKDVPRHEIVSVYAVSEDKAIQKLESLISEGKLTLQTSDYLKDTLRFDKVLHAAS